MKKTILIAVFLLLLSGLAGGEVLIVLKNGQSFTWGSYTEDEVRYCTWKYVGRRVCISKAEVVSITDARKQKPPEGPDYSPPDETWPGKEKVSHEKSLDSVKKSGGLDNHDDDSSTLEERRDAFRRAVEKDYQKRYYPSKFYDRR